MSILIIAATAIELTPFVFSEDQEKEIKLETMVSGVGLLSTALSLTKRIQKSQPSMVIQVGIAGSFNEKLAVGQAVVVASESIGDMGVEENGRFNTVFDMGLSDPDCFPFSGGKLINPHHELINQTGLSQVHGISINEISTSQKRIQFYKDQLGADIESMEGAALHMVCLENKIPFLQIRGISNGIGERDKSQWKIAEATKAVADVVKNLITNMTLKP
jgi:futalosine hydrolase